MSTFKIIADFVNGVTVEEGLIEFIQQDNNTCKLDITLLKNNVEVDMTNKKATFTSETPSGATIEETHLQVVEAATGKVSIVLGADMILEAGKHKAQIQLYPLNSYERESTLIFTYNVSRSLLTDQKIVASSRFGTLEEMIITVEGLQTQVDGNEETIKAIRVEAEAAKTLSLESASNSVQSSIAAENSAQSAAGSALLIDDIIEGARQSAKASQDSAAASQSSADQAQRALEVAHQAANEVGTASNTANQAVAQVQNMVEQVASAVASVTDAHTKANQALGYATDSKNISDQAINTANQAATNANNALNTANQTLTEVNVANSKIEAAMNVANEYKDVATKAATDAKAEATKAAGSAREAASSVEAGRTILLDTQTAKTQAKTEADRAKTEADRTIGAVEDVKNHTTLNGQPQTNFDFSKDEVVADGLVDLQIKNTNEIRGNAVKLSEQQSNSNFTLLLNFVFYERPVSINVDQNQYLMCSSYEQTNRDYVAINKNVLVTQNSPQTPYIFNNGQIYEVAIVQSSGKIYLYINGCKINEFERKTTDALVICGNRVTNYTLWKDWKGSLYYNRILTQQEISHNFQVLNNSPSIASITATDSSGTKKYALATDSRHVAMDAGFNVEEAYTGLVKTMSQQFTSTTDEINVANAIVPSKVISGSVEGQTVKNEFHSIPKFNNVLSYIDNEGVLTITDTSSGFDVSYTNPAIKGSLCEIKPNTKYTGIMEILETNYAGKMIFQIGGIVQLDATTTGVKIGTFTTPATIDSATTFGIKNNPIDRVVGRKIKLRFGIYEGDLTTNNPVISPQFGINSTIARITVNGQNYTICDEYGKLIELAKVGDASDKVELKEDGSVVNTKENVLLSLGNETWVIRSFSTNDNYYYCSTSTYDNVLIDNYHKGYSNKFDISGAFNEASQVDKECFTITYTVNKLRFCILKSKIKSATSESVNEYLKNDGIIVVTKAKTPTITHIPANVNPAIPITQKDVKLEAGGSVKPISFKVNVAVDQTAALKSEIEDIKRQLGAIAAIQHKYI